MKYCEMKMLSGMNRTGSVDDFEILKKDDILNATIKFITIIIGVSGNAMNLFVLTRNKLKVTTIYLVAISTVDLLRLLTAICKGIEKFQWVHLGYSFYWTYRPIIEGIMNSTQAMSLLFIVSFTVNRYIVINNPLKQHKLNTIKFNRCLIIGIVLVCVLSRIPIVKDLMSKECVNYNEVTHKLCKLNSTLDENGNGTSFSQSCLDDVRNLNKRSLMEQEEMLVNSTEATTTTINILENNSNGSINSTSHWKKILYYMIEYRKQNRTPSWYRYTIAVSFALIPTLILIGFNIKIILILKKNKAKRKDITNSVIVQQQMTTETPGTPGLGISKENAAIIQLISIKAVIALLRLPYLILMFFLYKLPKNTKLIIKDLAAFSLDLNAVLNFFIFCIIPTYYRKHFIETMSDVCCFKKISNKENKKKIKKAAKIDNVNNIGGLNNLAFIGDTLNSQISISTVSDTPDNQIIEHPKLQELHSGSSSSSGGTGYSSQISQNSESSVL